jgi:hypothetical protein
MGGCAPYSSLAGMFKSSTKMIAVVLKKKNKKFLKQTNEKQVNTFEHI